MLPVKHQDIWLLSSTIVRQYISLVLSHQSCGDLLQQISPLGNEYDSIYVKFKSARINPELDIRMVVTVEENVLLVAGVNGETDEILFLDLHFYISLSCTLTVCSLI